MGKGTRKRYLTKKINIIVTCRRGDLQFRTLCVGTLFLMSQVTCLNLRLWCVWCRTLIKLANFRNKCVYVYTVSSQGHVAAT